MSIAGIGTDILVTSRMGSILKGSPRSVQRFLDRVLHPIEIDRFSNITGSANQIRYLASTWTSKEALFKALDEERQQIFQFKHWYRAAPGGNNQKSQSHEMLSELHKFDSEKILVSVSHDGDYTCAFVVRSIIQK